MFQVGDQVVGFTYSRGCERVEVRGTFVCMTDDPEEYIQDVIIRDEAGNIHYIDEQEAYPPHLFPSDFVEGTSLDPAIQAEEDFDHDDLLAIVEAYDVRQAA